MTLVVNLVRTISSAKFTVFAAVVAIFSAIVTSHTNRNVTIQPK